MRRIAMVVGFLAAALAGRGAHAGLIVPVSASGSGTYNNSPALLIDGSLPPRYTTWTSSTNVFWDGTTPSFTINLGGLYTVQNLTVDVDNNDDYLVESSTDGIHFTSLFKFLASDGPVPVNPGGMDILTTDSSFPSSPGNNTTPAYVGRGFSQVDASYLRISATAGDNAYAVGEVQAFGFQAAPEPASLTSCLVGAIALAALRVRRRSRSA